jgi:hypothetical protein
MFGFAAATRNVILFLIRTASLPPMCFYLVVVVGLACTNDPESYVGGSVATGRVSQTEQVEG